MPDPSQPPSLSAAALRHLFASHPRLWRDFRFVYPVISRRSRGLSIGVNLNPDKACNFDCVYCCVDRTQPAGEPCDVDLDAVERELDVLLALTMTGELWKREPFNLATPEYRRLNDIAFSGNGEPTSYGRLGEAVRLAARLKAAHRADAARLIVITNATLLDRPNVEAALRDLDAAGGEVWAKLDAGTEAYHQAINRSVIPLSRIVENIRACGGVRAVVIQSLFMTLDGAGPSDQEIAAWCEVVAELRQAKADGGAGCRIARVQVYTVARRTAERHVAPLEPARLDAIGARLRERCPGLAVEVYGA